MIFQFKKLTYKMDNKNFEKLKDDEKFLITNPNRNSNAYREIK